MTSSTSASRRESMSKHAWFLSLKLAVGCFFFSLELRALKEIWELIPLVTLYCSRHCQLPLSVLFFTYTWHVDNDEKYYSARAKDKAKILGWKNNPTHRESKTPKRGGCILFISMASRSPIFHMTYVPRWWIHLSGKFL